MLAAAALLLVFPSPVSFPQESSAEDTAPAPKPRGRAVVYRVDHLESLDGDAVDNAVIVVRDGSIERIGQAVVVPEHAEIHDLRGNGSTAMPPLVLAHADFLQHDSRGRGANARFRAIDSLWVEEKELHDLLEQGILIVGVDPPGAGIPGRSSVIETTAPAPHPEALVEDLDLVFTVDANASAKELLRKAIDGAEKAIEKEKKARAEWKKARADWEAKHEAATEQKKGEEGKKGSEGEQKAPRPSAASQASGGNGQEREKKNGKEEKEPPKEFTPPPIPPDTLPVVEWLRKERVAQIWIDNAAEWLHWLDVLGDRDLAWEAVFQSRGTTNLAEVAAAIAESGVRVYVPARIAFLPYTRIRVNLAAELLRAGVKRMVLEPAVASPAAVRAWRVGLADLVREGLDRERTLRAITVEPAAALGQEERIHPLTVGGSADFVIFDGDPLDPTVKVRMVIARGEPVYDRVREEEEKEKRQR